MPVLSHAVSCGHRVDAIKVLLIDDDERCCLRPMTRAFRTLGCEVETATDGQIGLEVAAHFRPDCTIVDHVMPGLIGLPAWLAPGRQICSLGR